MIGPVAGRPWSYARSNLDFALPFKKQDNHSRSLIADERTRTFETLDRLTKTNMLLKDVLEQLDNSAIPQETETNPPEDNFADEGMNPLSAVPHYVWHQNPLTYPFDKPQVLEEFFSDMIVEQYWKPI